MDDEKDKKANEKDKNDNGDFLFPNGAIVGAGTALTAAVVGLVGGGVIDVRGDDPLHPFLDKEGHVGRVSPYDMADEIAKHPVLQKRWKAMRELVESIDQQVGENLEHNAGASKDTAQHWRDKATQPEASSGQKQAR
ncbi:MAG: hypothetical protein AB7I48_27645 [Planctomycetaceae bacterium]